MTNFLLLIFGDIEYLGQVCCRVGTYILLLILNPGHTYSEVKEQRLLVKKVSGRDSDMTLGVARAYFGLEARREKEIKVKVRLLLVIAALLILSNAVVLSNLQLRWLILLSLIPAAASLFLSLVHEGVRAFTVPDYEKTDESELARSYVVCTERSSQINNFNVGIYRAAWRAMVVSILLFLFIVIYIVME